MLDFDKTGNQQSMNIFYEPVLMNAL